MKLRTYCWTNPVGGMIGIAWGRFEIALHLGWLVVDFVWREPSEEAAKKAMEGR